MELVMGIGFLSQNVCISDRQSVFVTERRFAVSTVSLCHRQSISVTDSLCPSKTLCVCTTGDDNFFYTKIVLYECTLSKVKFSQ